MIGNGSFGTWITDKYGLPAYKYTCNQFKEPIAKTRTTYGFSNDHFHQIGNDKITATVHNGGYVQVLESSRGFQWLTYRNKKKKKFGGGVALFQTKESNRFLSDLYDPNIFKKYLRIFGMGYFQKEIQVNDLKLKHKICTPFSDDPIIISEIIVTNDSESNSINNLKLIDFWDLYLHHILRSLVVTWNKRKSFGRSKIINVAGKIVKLFQKITRTDTDGSRNKFDKKFDFKLGYSRYSDTIILTPKYKKKPPVKINEPAKHNYYPKSIFLSMIQGEPQKIFFSQNKLVKKGQFKVDWDSVDSTIPNSQSIIKNPCVGIGTELTLKPKETKKVVCIFGYDEIENIEKLKLKYKNLISEKSILIFNAEKWKNSLIELNCEKDTWLSRETKWHTYYTRSACYFDEYSGLHKFPQSSIYQFGHGFDGALRDFVLYLKSIIFIDSRLAKEFLIYIVSLMAPDGKLPYSIHGFSKISSMFVHANPSDLHIFLIWGILQYVFTTRDFDFLQERISFYPLSKKKSSTVLERINLSFQYLFSDKIGFGEHGLIKSNDGDWNDIISSMAKNRKKFIKYGESNFNSAFVLYIIPKILPLLNVHNPELAELCSEKYKKLKKMVFKTWNGKWFYRCWDGQGNPIGDNNIFLEHHTWLLIAGILSNEKASIIIDEIYKNLDEPSPIGQYISYPPQKTRLNILPKGWDVNGGVWHAINALLTWGYSKYDVNKAYESLKKNSMTKKADIYPNIWYGIWSGPDAYIADYAEHAGEAFYHFSTPMCDWPLMNLNIHACYLLSVIKMVGFETDYDSITISPKIHGQDFKFKSPLLTIESEANLFSIEFKPLYSKDLTLKIKKPKWWNTKSKIILNGKVITGKTDLVKIQDDHVAIKIIENYEKIKILFE